ncbi:MAG: hypothetical protein ACREVL_14290 [Solimonas sp.]
MNGVHSMFSNVLRAFAPSVPEPGEPAPVTVEVQVDHLVGLRMAKINAERRTIASTATARRALDQLADTTLVRNKLAEALRPFAAGAPIGDVEREAALRAMAAHEVVP